MQLTTMNGAGRVNTTHDMFWLRVNLINHRAGNTRVVVDVSSNLLFACLKLTTNEFKSTIKYN